MLIEAIAFLNYQLSIINYQLIGDRMLEKVKGQSDKLYVLGEYNIKF